MLGKARGERRGGVEAWLGVREQAAGKRAFAVSGLLAIGLNPFGYSQQ